MSYIKDRITAYIDSSLITTVRAYLETTGADGGDGSDTKICISTEDTTFTFRALNENYLEITAHGDDEASRLAEVFEILASRLRRAGFQQ